MYQSHFHLNDRPFASAPNPDHYFPAASVEQAREVIALNVERASGASIVMGPVGSGKTLLCQLLSNQFENELPVCLLNGDRLQQREELVTALLHGLGLPYHGLGQADLRTTLTDHLTGQGCRAGILVVIDDAERMPEDVFEELRVLTNVDRDGQPAIRLVLAGANSLDECVSNPRLESLNQRIVGRLFIENFNREETADYIRARINASGGDANTIFSAEAWDRVFLATNGVPRLVNQICDHALLMASVMEVDTVDGDTVEAAWADLQQLPMPKPIETPQAGGGDVVEFGSLDDDESAFDIESLAATVAAQPSGQVEEVSAVEPGEFGEANPIAEPTADPVLDPVAALDVDPGGIADSPADVIAANLEQSNASETNHGEDPAEEIVNPFEPRLADEEITLPEPATMVDRHSPFADEPDFSSAITEPTTLTTFEPPSDPDSEENSQSYENDGSNEPQEFAETVAHSEPELTMEQIVNPFDEEFEEEEVVIQQFSSPASIARGEFESVTSAYSRHLSAQLSAAHPGLRVNSLDEESVDDESESFEPLSALDGYSPGEPVTGNEANSPSPPDASQQRSEPTASNELTEIEPITQPAVAESTVTEAAEEVTQAEIGQPEATEPEETIPEPVEAFVPADDPVMPDESLMPYMQSTGTPELDESVLANSDELGGANELAAASFVDEITPASPTVPELNANIASAVQEELKVEQQVRQLTEMAQAASPDASEAAASLADGDGNAMPESISEPATPRKAKRKKVFRQLFSSLRRN